ncbi:MAG: FtsX-like permease family protein [Methanobacteriota archaeon]|nr:MAG: FtsX-like permease family protein [Euryarchaeota archaeon]
MDTDLILVILVTAASLAVVGWAGRKRFPLRIGVGNFFRRKTQVAIVVTGLLIGTAIVTSSFVIQTTFGYTIRSAVFRSLDAIDETIFVAAVDGTHRPFSDQVFRGLQGNLSAMRDVLGLAPRYMTGGAVIDQNSQLFEPTAQIIGFDPTWDLGSFVRMDGTRWNGSGTAATEGIINQALAKATEAKVGDSLAAQMGGPSGPATLLITVKEIVQDKERGAWDDDQNLFVPLGTLQATLGIPGLINTIIVANLGGVTEGYLRSDAVAAEIEPFLPTSPSFTISKLKAETIQSATEDVDRLAQVFVLLSFFTVVAGILLIVNIFVMLAEERKGEMGVARALGMRRTNLMQSFVSEGLLYALMSSFVGTLTGLLVAAVILWGFSQVFPSGFGGSAFQLAWTPSDLINGFSIGFLITMATIGLASLRVSKLNIVRAIRDIPEPVARRSTRRQVALGAGLAALGVIATLAALATRNLHLQDLGPSASVLGLAILTMRVVPPRVVFTGAGVVILAWVLSPWKFFGTASADITLFIVLGLLLILGGLLIVLFNSDTVLALATRVVRGRTWRPVVRTAIAYPMNKKFRTGVTLASIALVMFTIATMSCIQAIVGSSITQTSVRESGGFDLVANSVVPIPQWDSAFSEYKNVTDSANFTDNVHGLPRAPRVAISRSPGVAAPLLNSSLIGVPSGWTPPFSMQARDSAYPDDRAAWSAIEDDPGLAILDGTVVPNDFGPNFGTFTAHVGDVFHYRNATSTIRSVRIIGILYEQFAQGLWVSAATVKSDFGIEASSLFYFDVTTGVDVTRAGHDLERHFIAYQLITVNIQALLDAILETTMGVFNLLQAYLALGLIVGIAGLGVITMRNVVERRQETGALRALGFRKSMILRSFLFELSFIALTGITMGSALGIALSYDLFLRFFAGQASFVIPWGRLALLAGIALLGSILATASPAIRASKMPPAEALRSFE